MKLLQQVKSWSGWRRQRPERRPRGRHAVPAAVPVRPTAGVSWSAGASTSAAAGSGDFSPPTGASASVADGYGAFFGRVRVEPQPHLADPLPPRDLLAAIDALFASGEAWADPCPPGPSGTAAGPTARPERAGGRPPEPAATTPPVLPTPRVQLGFRDGTATSLDPDSDHAAALQELASLLTSREGRPA